MAQREEDATQLDTRYASSRLPNEKKKKAQERVEAAVCPRHASCCCSYRGGKKLGQEREGSERRVPEMIEREEHNQEERSTAAGQAIKGQQIWFPRGIAAR